jgi:plasmid replication initiation protein
MSKEIVKYNNKMNKIPLKNFEKIDMNFFYAICSKVKNVGSDQVEIPFDDLKEMTGYDQSQNRLVNDLDRMNSKLIQCRGRFEDEDEIVYFNLFSTFRIVKSRKVLKIRVNPDFTWLMNNIAKEFTSSRSMYH